METAIDYLNKVHGDLLDAAKREHSTLSVVPGRRQRRAPPAGLVAAVVAVLLSAGLVGLIVRSDGLGDAAGGGAGEAGATGATGAAESPAPEPGSVRPPGDAAPPSAERIIRTAQMSLVISRDSFDERFGDAVDVAEDHGGFVADSRSRTRSGSLTLRVPADSFSETLRALRALGIVDAESVRGEDVTARYVDLNARLRIARARREVLLGLMGEATTIPQTVHVLNELDETQLRIEELQGQLRLLDDRTSLATIRVAFREEGVEPEAEVETPSIPNAFERASAGFVGVIAAVVIGLGYLLPLLALGLATWFVWSRIQRRRGR